MKKPVAMLLCGCGHLDGAEINETVMSILALRLRSVDLDFFSLDKPQVDVLDHLSQKPLKETRNLLQESARIVRGKIRPLGECNPDFYAGVVLPGGFGVAKNFCSIAKDGKDASADPEVSRVVKHFLKVAKPVMAVCISPALVGLIAKNEGIKLRLTHGAADSDIARMNEVWGHESVAAKSTEYILDQAHKVVSTPAFMNEISMEEAWPGIDGAAGRFVELL